MISKETYLTSGFATGIVSNINFKGYKTEYCKLVQIKIEIPETQFEIFLLDLH